MGRERVTAAAPARRPIAVLTLYGRPGCHLCAEARDAILDLCAELGGIELREVDIERDEKLLAAYLERIPVIALDGEIVSELALDQHDLRRRLHTVLS
jgi:glutaredoxin